MKIKSSKDFVKKFVQFVSTKDFKSRQAQQDILDDLYSSAVIINFNNRKQENNTSNEDSFINRYVVWFENVNWDKIKTTDKAFKEVNRLVNSVDLTWLSSIKEIDTNVNVTVKPKRKRISKYL